MDKICKEPVKEQQQLQCRIHRQYTILKKKIWKDVPGEKQSKYPFYNPYVVEQ